MSFLFNWMRQLLQYLGATNRNNITKLLIVPHRNNELGSEDAVLGAR